MTDSYNGSQADATAFMSQLAGVEMHPEDFCHRCLGPNVSWCAPSPLWNYVMRGDDINGSEPFDGIVCLTCFAILAQDALAGDMWRLEPQRVTVPLKTTTPSGRVWNPSKWLWEPSTSTDNK